MSDEATAPQALPTFVAELPLTRRALAFAAAHHSGQRRDADAAPFILHPLEVAHLLYGREYSDHVIAAAVLHDVIEDTDAELPELEQRFGPAVSGLVRAVSEPTEAGDYRERKAHLRAAVATASPDAMAIYAADKIARTRELRMQLARTREAVPDPDQLEHYWASLDMLETRLADDPFVRQLRFELEALALLPPGTA